MTAPDEQSFEWICRSAKTTVHSTLDAFFPLNHVYSDFRRVLAWCLLASRSYICTLKFESLFFLMVPVFKVLFSLLVKLFSLIMFYISLVGWKLFEFKLSGEPIFKILLILKMGRSLYPVPNFFHFSFYYLFCLSS